MQTLEFILQFFFKYSVIQGLIISLWLTFQQKQFTLSLFFLNITYLLFIYLLETNGWYRILPHLIWTNVPSWFLIGPLLFLHAKKIIANQSKNWGKLDYLHFIPAIIIFIYLLPFYQNNGQTKIDIFESFYSETYIVDYIQLIYLVQLTLYAILGTKHISAKLKILNENLSDSDLVNLQLAKTLYTSLSVYIVCALTVAIILGMVANASFAYYSIAFFILSFPILIATIFYFKRGLSYQPSATDFELEVNQEVPVKYASSALTVQDMKKIIEDLEMLMEKDQLYKNHNLKLSELSGFSKIPSHHISQSLNQQLGKSFFSYINEHRVNEVKKQLQIGRHQSITLLALAEECGFKSQTSFYRIFKQHTGLTPRTYLEKIT